MNFTSPEFLIFFPVVLILFYVLPKRYRWVLLLIASWAFYLSWNPWTGILLILATACSFIAGIRIEDSRKSAESFERGAGRKPAETSKERDTRNQRMEDKAAEGSSFAVRFWSVIGIGVPLACLIIFKYAGFFANTTSDLLAHLGIQSNISLPKFVLPIGISFYTFQTLSYVIDVRRGTVPAERHFGFYALFVSFFPQLVAGPIERPGNLIPQLRAVCDKSIGTLSAETEQISSTDDEEQAAACRQAGLLEENSTQSECYDADNKARIADRAHIADDLTAGLRRILIGFFKKLVVADFLASFVEPVYGNPAESTSLAVILATVFFAVQIYCDFSGYSDIACGAARMLGIRLMENFRLPYLSASVREFWRRWHISLSSWLADYIYIPLGGNRRGMARQLANVMIVFAVSGLWHGANMTFVVWGILHGAAVCAETFAASKLVRKRESSREGDVTKLVGDVGRKGGVTISNGDAEESVTNIADDSELDGGRKMAKNRHGKVGLFIRRILTFAFVCFTWIFFRAGSLADAQILIGRLFSVPGADVYADTLSLMGITGMSIIHIVLALGCLVLLDSSSGSEPVEPAAIEATMTAPVQSTAIDPANTIVPAESSEFDSANAGPPGHKLNKKAASVESHALFIILMVMIICASWLMLLAESAGNVFIYFRF